MDHRTLAVATTVSVPTPIRATKTDVDELFEADVFDISPITRTNLGKSSIINSKNILKKN